MWMATPSGLARFDGNSFLIFDADSQHPNHLSTANIRDILIDEDNLLWIIHFNGKVDRMNPDTFEVQRDIPPANKIVKSQFFLQRNGSVAWIMGNRSKGEWFIESGEEYLLFDDSNSLLKNHFQKPHHTPENYGFKTLNSGGLWQLYEKKITYKENEETRELAFPLPEGFAQDFKRVTFVYLTLLDESRIFFAGRNKLFVFDRSKGSFEIESLPEVPNLWTKGILPAAGSTSQVNGQFVFAYQGYVMQMDPITYQVNVLWKSPRSESLPVSALTITDSNTLWVGVSGGGLYKVNLLTPAFIHQPYETNFLIDVLKSELGIKENTIPQHWIKKIGNYGLRTHYQGDSLFIVNDLGFKGARQAYVYVDGQLSSLPVAFSVPDLAFMGVDRYADVTMAIDQDGWLHQWESIDEPASYKQIIPVKNKEDRQNTLINDLVIDANEQWIMTKLGVLLQIKEGEIVGTFNPGSGKSTFVSLKQDPVEDSILWIGTLGDGLIRWNKTAKQTTYKFMKKDGLVDDRIAAIEFDDAHQLWLATFNGVIKFNKEHRTFTNYKKLDGIKESEFNRHHSLKLPDGRIVFGGSLGYTTFDPLYFKADTAQLRTNIAAIYLNDKDVFEGEDADIDANAINQITRMTLPYGKNLLTIELAASGYNNIANTRYRYQLSNNTNGWVDLGDQHIVRLGKLTPGRYRLTMNVSNSQGVWSQSEKQIILEVASPPWLTWWAFVFYAIAFIIIGYVYWRSYRRKIIRQQEEAFNKREAKRLLEMNRIKTRFFSNITHEFRTPLTLILSPLEKYLEDRNLTVRTRKILRSNYDNANRLLKLVNQLLDIAKLESGQMRSHKVKGQLLGFIKENIDRFKETAENKGITLSFEAATTEDHFEFDQNNFEQIIQNLLSNAIKFTGDGGHIWVRLFLSASEQGDRTQLTFEVEDNGIGIPKESLGNLFDRFYQVDDTANRSHEGTGIGLALVKELTELMGGQVTVSSEAGKGAKFTVIFEVRHLDNSTAFSDVRLNEDVKIIEVEHSDLDLLILVVEDNEELREFILESLSEHHRVLGAKDGREAWDMVHQELPDVIISDVMMPYMNGFELCQKVKADTRSMHIHMMLLTAKASQAAKEEGLTYGADEYLTKPFHPRELELRLVNFKEKRTAMQRHLLNTILPGTLFREVPKVDDLFIRDLVAVIEKHLKDDQLDVTFLAKEMNMSKSTLNRKMRALFNLPTNQFIRDYRLQQSTKLLQSGSTVAEAAYQVGFESPSYFAQCFKTLFKKSPSEFQKQPV